MSRTWLAARRWTLVTDLRHAPPVVRLLVLTQLVFNIGFYAVVPYLSVYLTAELGIGTAMVGLVLGIRTFSQQGLFVVGGILTDKLGAKPVIIAGCAVRIAGFLLLARADALGAVLIASTLIGFAAALFSPAVEAALATQSGRLERDGGPRRVEVFALFSVCGQIGSFTGPLVGSALLLVDFRAACVVAAVVFVAVAAAHVRWYPAEPGEHHAEPWTAGWKEVAGNRLFVVFAIAASGNLIAYNQLYLLLPLEVQRVTGSQAALGWFFAGSSVLIVIAQLPITRLTGHRPARLVLPAGYLLIASAFVGVAVAIPLAWNGFRALIPAIAFVVLLAIGEMITVPLTRDVVASLAPSGSAHRYFRWPAPSVSR